MDESASGAGEPGRRALPRRLASGTVLAAVALLAVWQGGWPFSLLLFVVLMLGLWEFLRMAAGRYPVLEVQGLLMGGAVLILVLGHRETYVGACLVVVALGLIAQSLKSPITDKLPGLALTVMGVAYVVGLGLHIFWLRELPNGSALLVTTLLGIWAADTFAFFVGMWLGRTPLAPEVSPRKSVEGLVGGVVGAGVVVAVAAIWLAPELGTGRGIVVGAMIGLVAPAGDLLESMIKRNLGLKDTSRLIPGHGGVLDRVDSLLVAAPVAYYLFRFLLR